MSDAEPQLDAPQADDRQQGDNRLAVKIEEAARRLGVSVPTIRKLLRQRKLKRLPVRHVVIPIASLEEYIRDFSTNNFVSKRTPSGVAIGKGKP